MIADNILNNLSLNNLRFLDAESLTNQKVLDKLFKMSEDAVFDLESAQALQFYEQLNKIMLPFRERLESNQEINDKINAILTRFFWKGFPSMLPKYRANALSENLVFSLSVGADVRQALQRILNPYEFDFEPDKEQRRQWIYTLENNQEDLGNKNLDVDGQNVRPKIQYWLKLYNANQNLKGERRTKLNHLNFLDKEKNVSLLSDDEKNILSKIIELYDWLLFPTPGPKVVSDEEYSKISPYITTQNVTLPDNLAKETVPLNAVDGSLGQQARIPKISNFQMQQKNPSMPGLNLGEGKSDSGKLRQGQDINQIKREIDEKKQSVQKQIDQKLEDLNKRVNK